MNARTLLRNCFRLLVLLLVLFPVHSTQAIGDRETSQLDPYLVKDIYLGAAASDPQNAVMVNGILFFTADPGDGTGRELWKSDGTAEGTVMVKDINTIESSDPQNLVNVNGTLFFTAHDGWKHYQFCIECGNTNGRELWRSDGTVEGTVMIKNINSLATTVRTDSDVTYHNHGWSSDPQNLVNVNGTLFFTAHDGWDEPCCSRSRSTHGRELWKSDGTAQGTVLVKNINALVTTNTNEYPEPTYNYHGWSSDPQNLVNVNGTLFFTAQDGWDEPCCSRSRTTNGHELWKSDGTNAGTVMVKNINTIVIKNTNEYPAPVYNYLGESSDPQNLVSVNGALFFTAQDGSGKRYSDGSTYDPTQNGRELWKSDGTPEGTVMVKDINYLGVDHDSSSGINFIGESSDPQNLVNVNGTLFFTAQDGWKEANNQTLTHGRELWALSTTVNLSTTLSSSTNLVVAGSTATYVLSITNLGGIDATNVVVTDTLPTGFTSSSVTASQGSCSGTSIVVCQLGGLTSKGTATVNLVTMPTITGVFTNTVESSSNEADSDITNNTSTLTTTVLAKPIADLSIALSGSSSIVQVGSNMVYQSEITNHGVFAAANVVVNYPLSVGANFISANVSQGNCTESNRAITCNFGTLEVGQRATANLTVQQTSTGQVVNTMTVGSDADDLITGNNSASVTTEVVPEPLVDLSLSLTDSINRQMLNTGNLTYQIKVQNHGASPATNARTEIYLPDQVMLASVSPSKGSCTSERVVRCNLGAMSVNDIVTIVIVVNPTTVGNITVTGYVMNNERDPYNQNNQATDQTTIAPVVDLVPDAIEVTQAVQDLNNSVRLVAGKTTFVRLHVHSAIGDGNYPSRARLRLQRGDRVTWVDSYGGAEIQPLNRRNRATQEHAFLFLALPSDFTQAGSLTIMAEINPYGDNYWRRQPEPLETNYDNNIIQTTVNFEMVPEVQLIIDRISYGTWPNLITTPHSHAVQLVDWLRRAYPVSSIRWWERNTTILTTTVPLAEDVNTRLTSIRAWERANGRVGENVRYYGMVDDLRGTNFITGLAATIPGNVASGPSGVPGIGNLWNWDTDGSYGDWYGGHEIAHMFGRRHPGRCGNPEQPKDPKHPATGDHPEGHISPNTLDNNNTIYGFDAGTRAIYPPTWTDVMTYCDNQWVSDFTYEGLMDFFQNNLGQVTASAHTINPTDRVLVVGSMNLSNNQVQLEPIFILPNAGEIEPRVPGNYTIVLRNGSESELARYPFTPEKMERGHHEQSATDQGEALESLLISELVPYVPETARIDIEGPSGLLTTIHAGMALPVMTLTAPNGGELLNSETVTVSWTASDPDTDPLRFNLEYSADNGATWKMIAQNLTENQVVVPMDALIGSTQGYFRVWVSDGIHTANDVSDAPFTVPNHLPTVQILNPQQGASSIVNQTITLSAYAYDNDSGSMDGNQVKWSSNMNGLLGYGAELHVANLSVGDHTITLEANDGQGGVTTATVQIKVIDSVTPVLQSHTIYLPLIQHK